MKLGDPILPVNPESDYDKQLNRTLLDAFRKLFPKVNGLANGAFTALDNTATAAPTTGTYAQGDKIWHSAPVEAGVALSKYVVLGYVCTVGGTPGTWVQMRVLTGN